jgi:hypothetical protein
MVSCSNDAEQHEAAQSFDAAIIFCDYLGTNANVQPM